MTHTTTDKQEPKKISLNQTQHFDRDGFSGDVYIGKNDNKNFNALIIDVHGKHPLKKIISGTRNYLVLEGTDTFTLNGKTTKVEKGDLFIIPEEGEYEYEGKMALFEFNVPGSTSDKLMTREK